MKQVLLTHTLTSTGSNRHINQDSAKTRAKNIAKSNQWGWGEQLADAVQVGAISGLLWLLLAWSGDLLASEQTSYQQAAEPNHTEDLNSGLLQYQNDAGEVLIDIPLETHVSMQISGWVNRVQVRQTFKNPTDDWLSGKYLFPLPTNAAVDGLKMHIGSRVIEGQIQTKAKAKKTFAAAKAAGKRASLVEQKRPNMFTSAVANLGPRETLIVEVNYQELVDYDAGEFSLRFPMTITPRYRSQASQPEGGLAQALKEQSSARLESGAYWWPKTETRQKALTGRATDSDEVLDNGVRVSMNINLDGGIGLAELSSTYHDITKVYDEQGNYQISLKPGYRADRDFELRWRLATGEQPQAVMFHQLGRTYPEQRSYNVKGEDTASQSISGSQQLGSVPSRAQERESYQLLMVMPPHMDATTSAVLPRELILVVDTSGSMSGDAMIQARQATLEALEGLAPQDSFNIIAFNHQVSKFAPQSIPVNPQNISQAKRFVQRLISDGGTELGLAMQAALLDPQSLPTESEQTQQQKLRQVIFMTDGAIQDEKSLFNLIQNSLGVTRLFTVGIGSAPNSHFMQRAAHIGRGSYTYIGKTSEVRSKMKSLLNKVASPVLTDIELAYADGTVPDYWPSPITDLYFGEPILITIKSKPSQLQPIQISGQIAGQFWSQRVDVSIPTKPMEGETEISQTEAMKPVQGSAKGLDLVWARQQISALALQENPMTASKIKQQITGLALSYHLVSKHTSLVAVDVTPARPSQAVMNEGVVRSLRPHHQLAPMPQTASSSLLYIQLGMGLMIVSALWLLLCFRRQRGIAI